MKLLYLPWLLLLLAGVASMLVTRDAFGFVIGLVPALTGVAGWVVVADSTADERRARGTPRGGGQ